MQGKANKANPTKLQIIPIPTPHGLGKKRKELVVIA
jgi:hypothetical protein